MNIFPTIRRVIMRCDADGHTFEGGDGYPPAFETNAFMFTWLGFYFAIPFGDVRPFDARANWGT